VVEGASYEEAKALALAEHPDLIIVDYELPDGTAFDMLTFAKERDSQEAIIVMTGLGTIELAVQAIKLGAEHFTTKPVDQESLAVLIRRTLDAQRNRRQHDAATTLIARSARDPFLGKSKRVRAFQELADAVKNSEAPVLILGETGTGKGVLARWLHDHGPRRAEPFVGQNCAGLSRELMESELFGHQRGAFTGAVANKQGLIDVANKGTLFLDEIGDLDLAVQPKLLTVLEDHSFRRLGEVRARKADVRLVAATHRDLAKMAQQDRFRQDLLYRINTITIEIPPLRSRTEDIPELAQAILVELCQRQGRPTPELAPDALQVLGSYAWPGNIRELRNVLERSLLFSKDGRIDRLTLGFDRTLQPDDGADGETLDDAERRHITRGAAQERRSRGRRRAGPVTFAELALRETQKIRYQGPRALTPGISPSGAARGRLVSDVPPTGALTAGSSGPLHTR
jgi:DNA-binding NtrC family response regulator